MNTIESPSAPAFSKAQQRHWFIRLRVPIGIALFVACALIRCALIRQQGLWADEFFSLAMATGHSLEQPASQSDPARGDYVQADRPMPPAYYRQYLEHPKPRDSLASVVRALWFSDTSPPLYYVLLHYWTEAIGARAWALRLFSIFFAQAAFPLLWRLSREVGGPRACVPVCALYTFDPFCVWYSDEGRMYSLMWFLATALMLLTVRRASGKGGLPLWSVVAAAGLYTHYFFLFVLMACIVWWLWQPGPAGRIRVIVAASIAFALAAPWYLRVPQQMSLWRVTAGWLKMDPHLGRRLGGPYGMAWGFVSPRGLWGGGNRGEAYVFVVVAAIAILGFLSLRRRFFTGRRALLWLCVAAACFGPALLDFVQHTYLTYVGRYAAAALPGIMLIGGIALSRCKPMAQIALSLSLGIGWGAALQKCFTVTNRIENFRNLAWVTDKYASSPDDVIVVHSIPSGVAGVAYYLEGETPIVSWVPQLKQWRLPEDLQRLIQGRRRVLLVEIHTVDAVEPEREWFAQNTMHIESHLFEGASLDVYAPREGERFPAVANDSR